MNCLSFDVGGTTVKYGLINSSHKVLKKDKFPTPANEEELIYLFSKIIKDNLSDISKISVAMPGYVSVANNKYLYGPHLQYDIDFSKLTNFSEYDFYLDNDGNVAAYCEYILNYKEKKEMQVRFGICLPLMIEKSKVTVEKEVVLSYLLLHQYGQRNVWN